MVSIELVRTGSSAAKFIPLNFRMGDFNTGNLNTGTHRPRRSGR
ncbi:hypothetical protein RISK_005700 [Rhodopirellula islandica]|uniref:Uncharacterized protein n=1 Tax=Rhodopirellula islandica TaxID=595434 RepID=A0A0J1EAI7_RHOIS|nr:hypothetical protein RISK_005700 [Rhodopirellula islandica]